MDTETMPQTGTRVAERLITRENVHFMAGAIQSGTANAISQVCQKYGTVYFNTNSSSPTESGKNCHRVKFVWDGSGENFARAAAKNAISAFGKGWFFLYNDYVWGQNTNAATKKVASGFGAEVVNEVAVPVGTRDFSSILLKIQQSKPDVVAAAVGGDDFKVMRQQVRDMGLDGKPAWLNNQQDWPDVYGLGADAAFGEREHGLAGIGQRHVTDRGYDTGAGIGCGGGSNQIENVTMIQAVPGHLYQV